MSLCYFEGQFRPLAEACLPITDHVIQRGVGVFDLVRTYNRRPMQLQAHLSRLLSSAAQLGIEVPWTLDFLTELVRFGIDQLEGEVLAKIYVTGGDRFVDDCRFPEPRLFATFVKLELPPEEVYRQGVRLYPVRHGRSNPTAKSIDYLSSYEKNRNDPGAYEVLYCPDGEITESAHSTFFLVKEGRIITAPSELVLAGTTRAILLQLMGEESIPVELRAPRLDELTATQEAFIAGSIKQIVPVVAVGELPVGAGQPGPMTERISQVFLNNVHRWVE